MQTSDDGRHLQSCGLLRNGQQGSWCTLTIEGVIRRGASQCLHFSRLPCLSCCGMYREGSLSKPDTAANTPRAMTSPSNLANHSSTWLSQDECIGGELQVKVRVPGKEFRDLPGIVLRRGASDHLDPVVHGLVGRDAGEEDNELCRAMAFRSSARHPAGPGVERCMRRERAIAEMLEAMPLGASRRPSPERLPHLPPGAGTWKHPLP